MNAKGKLMLVACVMLAGRSCLIEETVSREYRVVNRSTIDVWMCWYGAQISGTSWTDSVLLVPDGMYRSLEYGAGSWVPTPFGSPDSFVLRNDAGLRIHHSLSGNVGPLHMDSYEGGFIEVRKHTSTYQYVYTIPDPLVGTWQWVETWYPMTGSRSTPESTGHTMKYVFRNDGVVETYWDEGFSGSKSFELEDGGEGTGIPVLVLHIGDEISHMTRSDDTLVISQAYVDGGVDRFVRVEQAE
ncbi:MAG: hypothetical protein R2751_07090 [Bacteroidales bacterium]